MTIAKKTNHSLMVEGGINSDEELISFPELFARQLAKSPDNIAIIFEDQEYSYQTLDELSNQFKYAVSSQVSEQQTSNFCIGICIDKSPEAIAAMLGILKAGAAFVPLDPEYPTDRISYMVEDAAIQTIIAQPKHQQRLEPLLNNTGLQWIDCYKPLDLEEVATKRKDKKIKISPDDLAYIMYTSGSTGNPKGVQIEHAALACYCFADIDVYNVSSHDRTLQFSTINFDIAIEEIFPPLLTGSSIVIRPPGRSSSLNELSTIINNHAVTAVHIATAYWHEWVDLMVISGDKIPESLRLMVVTGEKVSTKHYQDWTKLCKQTGIDVLWCNAYGPTEATVSASVFIPDESFSEDNMPIGKPLKRYTAMIVDDEYNDLEIGKTGQLLIGGPALARGYLNRPELNAEVFVDVVTDKASNTVQRMYKTGDLARWHENGDIEFAGRIDHQIKLGSYRVEPGEIEVVINQHPEVLDSLITYDEVDAKKVLIAYVAQGDNKIKLDELSQFLKENLPAYMVPTRFILLKAFPITTNGKIDRKALPEPSESKVARTSSFIAPRNDLENKLASMWQEVLLIPEAGIYDDFFALGGSSLLAVGVVSRLVKEFDLELPVRDFFANPTISSQAKHIQYMLDQRGDQASDTRIDEEDDIRALRDRLPIVEAAFFGESKKLYGIHYKPPAMSPSQLPEHSILMCHPLGHEYPRSYRNLQQLAIQLAKLGYHVFRFDYQGTGNSFGASDEVTAQSCASDIQTAVDHIREQSKCKKLSVLAVRLGVPFVVKADLNNIENLIAWDPVMSGANYISMLEGLHKNITTGLNLFRIVRKKSDTDQLFGHAYNEAKRASLNELVLPASPSNQIKSSSLITSKGYLESEVGCKSLTKEWQHFSTDDDICWHDSTYTQRAFSSPEAFQSIVNILNTNNSDKDL